MPRMYALASVQRSADKAPDKVPQPDLGKGTEPALLVVRSAVPCCDGTNWWWCMSSY
jgi:hypothetical protein